MITNTLKLGKFDQGSMPKNKRNFLEPYHATMHPVLKNRLKFRDEKNSIWRSFLEVSNGQVKELQKFLKETGFMPHAKAGGVFAYKTAAAVRLFQHYVRLIDGHTDIGPPDGVVGRKTRKYIKKWIKEKKGTPDFVCRWGRASSDQPSADHSEWFKLLEKAKAHYLVNNGLVLSITESYEGETSTKKIEDWDTNPNNIHLIGIRRHEDSSKENEYNNDLFVLLINGMVFYFWGSTDPRAGENNSKGLAFLAGGQHEYKFGWHRISSSTKTYRALRPVLPGVLIFRDRDQNKRLTEEDLKKGLDLNDHINIHWSGIGSFNFSAGCQVIAGKSYIDDTGKLINCSPFAAVTYGGLGPKTRGAYDMLTDLIFCYAPPKKTTLCYTLAKDDDAFLSDDLTIEMIAKVVNKMKNT